MNKIAQNFLKRLINLFQCTKRNLLWNFLLWNYWNYMKQASLTRRSTTFEQKRSFQNFGSKNFFSWVLPLLDVRHCCKLPFYPISKKPNDPNSKNGEKPHFEPVLVPLAPKLGLKIWFSKIWLRQFLDIMVSS